MTKKRTKPAKRKAARKPKPGRKVDSIQAFKGFTKDMKCRDFQFEIGKSYEHAGKVSLCNSGFHAVEFPMDAFRYYAPADSAYAAVTLAGVSSEKEDDSKRCGSKITINAKLSIAELVKAHVTIVHEKADKKSIATGNYGHAAATGDSGHAAATGNSGHAAATGNYGHAAATGNSGHAAATGDSGHAAATGDSGHAAATGYYGHAAATGYYGHAAATGNYGHAAATGNYGHAAATGDSGHAAATGNYGAAFVGFNGKAKAGAKGSFVIAWFDKAADRARLIVGTPGENGIKPDQWYAVKGGALVETTSPS